MNKDCKCQWWIDDNRRCEKPATVEVSSQDSGNKWTLCNLHAECLHGGGWDKKDIKEMP